MTKEVSVSPSRTPPATRQPLPPLREPFVVRTPSPADTATINSDRPQYARANSEQLPSVVRRDPSSDSRRQLQPQPHHHHHHHVANPLLRPSLMIRAASNVTPPLASPSYLTVQPLQPTLSESPPHASSPIASSHGFGRKGSMSSTRSAATLPVPSSFAAYSPTDYRPRERTMSTMSSASSAAISSLAAIPAHHLHGHSASGVSMLPPPPTSRFPMHDPLLEAHPLIDMPFAVEHAAVIRICDPLGECFSRVAKAKVASKLKDRGPGTKR